MLDKQKSGSNLICDVLFEWPISKRFTSKQLHHQVLKYHPDITEGMVSGFITRAKEKGVIDEHGRQLVHRNKSAVIYRLIRKVAWDFHGPGIGSQPGRVGSYATSPLPQKELPLMPAEPEEKTGLTEAMTEDQKTLTYDNGSLTDQLIQIAYQVLALEEKPQPTLADFTTDELIEELKKRVK